jgi:hypothetical protein
MALETVTSTGYSLRNKFTGKLVGIIEEETDGNGYSNEYKYRLYDGDMREGSFMDFQVDSPEKAALVLVINTPWYNSTKIRPSWDGLDMKQYEVVEVKRVSSVEITPCNVPTPVEFGKPVDERKTLLKLAERYLGYSIPEQFREKGLSFVIVAAPEGETLASLKEKCTNMPVLLASSMGYPEMCLGVFELPEDYSDMFQKELGVGLILTHFSF